MCYDNEIKRRYSITTSTFGSSNRSFVRDVRRAFYDGIMAHGDPGQPVRVNGLKLCVNGHLRKVYSDGKIDSQSNMMSSARQGSQEEHRLLSWNVNELSRKIHDPDFVQILHQNDVFFPVRDMTA